MRRSLIAVALLILLGALIWLAWFWQPVAPAGSRPAALHLAAPPTGGDFRLDSAAGTLDLADLRGQVVLIYFGYTWCPDICSTNLAFIAAALKELTPVEQARVQVLFVSVDPDRDDPKRLADYAAYFHPRIRGVTGTPGQLAAAARLYGAAYSRAAQADSAMGYVVDHSAYTYVVDRHGRLAGTLDHATPPAAIVSTIRTLLADD
jgi:protein SCO1/2